MCVCDVTLWRVSKIYISTKSFTSLVSNRTKIFPEGLQRETQHSKHYIVTLLLLLLFCLISLQNHTHGGQLFSLLLQEDSLGVDVHHSLEGRFVASLDLTSQMEDIDVVGKRELALAWGRWVLRDVNSALNFNKFFVTLRGIGQEPRCTCLTVGLSILRQ